MEIIIGRHPSTRQLCIINGVSQKCYGQVNSVPMDVSRQHLSVTPIGGDKWLIKNLNDLNVTFVNGISVVSKAVSESDKIELGNSHYLFSWDAVREPKLEVADIRPLKQIWDEYDNGNLTLDIAERKFSVIRSTTGIISMSAIACAFFFGQGSTLQILLYGLAISISVIFFFIAHGKAQQVPLKRREIKEQFDRKWICPKCKRPINARSYIVLEQNDACPYCKAKYIK